MKCFLGIFNFLKEISSLSHSIIFLYFFALMAEEGFLISPCCSLELCIQMGISFLFSFAFHFSSFHSYLWGLLRSVFIPISKKGNEEECSNYHTIGLISRASKVMLKILQARLQQYWTVNFQMFKLVLEKAEEQEIKLPTSTGSLIKQESSRKALISALLTMPRPWLCRSQETGKFWKR